MNNNTKNVFTKIIICILAIKISLICMIYFNGYQHQQAAIEFWDKLYKPENDEHIKMDFGFWGNIYIPRGGPLISTTEFNLCPDTPLALVPLRIDRDKNVTILCGIAGNSHAVSFDVESVQNPEIKETLRKAFSSEYESTYGAEIGMQSLR